MVSTYILLILLFSVYSAVGLSLTLSAEQYEYIPFLTQASGLRLMVHNQSTMPFPEDRGFFIRPGQRTSIGFKKVENVILFVMRLSFIFTVHL